MVRADNSTEVIPHTPGPWRPGEYRFGCRYQLVMAEGLAKGYVCEVQGHGDCESLASDTALIAAAPELLALAKQYAEECSECHGTGLRTVHGTYCGDADDQTCPVCENIRAVINKAEGKV